MRAILPDAQAFFSATLLLLTTGIWLTGCTRPHVQAQAERYRVERCDGALADWSPKGSEFAHLAIFNILEVRPRHIVWNGNEISDQILSDYLNKVKELDPSPAISVIFDPNMNCDAVNGIRIDIQNKLHCSASQVCVEYSHAEWAARQKGSRIPHPPRPDGGRQ